MLISIIVVWSIILLAVIFMSVRWLPKEQCLLVKRGNMTIRMKQGLNFLIPFYDRVIANIIVEGLDVVLCKFSVEEDNYQFIGSYRIPDEFQNAAVIEIIKKFPQIIADSFRQKLINNEVDLVTGNLNEIAKSFEDEMRPVLKKEGIDIFNFRLVLVI